jgi:hypothetical protein
MEDRKTIKNAIEGLPEEVGNLIIQLWEEADLLDTANGQLPEYLKAITKMIRFQNQTIDKYKEAFQGFTNNYRELKFNLRGMTF